MNRRWFGANVFSGALAMFGLPRIARHPPSTEWQIIQKCGRNWWINLNDGRSFPVVDVTMKMVKQ